MPTLTAEDLRDFSQRLLTAVGVPESDAGIVAHHLVDANLCGHDSHGVLRIPNYCRFLRDGTYRADATLTILNETPAIIAADGGWGLGQVQAYRLLEKLGAKIAQIGLVAGSLRHCGHIGRVGEYAEWATARGYVFLACVNTHGAGRRVAPPGGLEGRISTNPICWGVPTEGEPIIVDFGTSAAAEGKIRHQLQKGEPVPLGWIVDASGQPTTDPSVLYANPCGTILPFGGDQAYKGFGLGLIMDLLAGGLSGGDCANPAAPIHGIGNAVLFVLFDPEAFCGRHGFLHAATALEQYVRSCPAAPGKTITLPGDPERATRAQRIISGITIPDGTWKLLLDEADRCGVPFPVTRHEG